MVPPVRRIILVVLLVTFIGSTRAARAEETEPARPLAPAMTGDTGIMRVYSARTGNVGYWDLGGHAAWFQQRGFVHRTEFGAMQDDYNEFVAGTGSISWAAAKWLELWASSQVRSNYNSNGVEEGTGFERNLEQANGALDLGAKLSVGLGKQGPVWLALKVGTLSPPNVDQVQFSTKTFGAQAHGIATLDFTERGLPFRMHGNLGYIVDRSGVLRLAGEDPARTFALNLHDRNRIAYGVGVEVPFRLFTPFLEVSGAKPTGVDIADSPGFLTGGLRVTPVRGLNLDIAGDFGLTSSLVDGLPATPQRQLVVGASYAFASRAVHLQQISNEDEFPDAAKERIAALEAEVAAERLRAEEAKSEADLAGAALEDRGAELDALQTRIIELQARLLALGDGNAKNGGDAAARAMAASKKARAAMARGNAGEARAAMLELEAAVKDAEKAAALAAKSGNSEAAKEAQEAANLARKVADLTRRALDDANAALVGPEVMSAWKIARDEAQKADDLRRRLGDAQPVTAVSEATQSTASEVMKAASAGERGDLVTAEGLVVTAEKEASAAQSAAQALKSSANTPEIATQARRSEITSGQARKAAAAARAALENARRIAARGAGASGTFVVDAGAPGSGQSPFRGLVLDATSFAPLGDAVVSFPDTNLSRILADKDSGFFRSFPFPPGTVTVSVTKPGYETLLQTVTVRGANDDVVRFPLRKEGAGTTIAANTPGLLKGTIVDESGKPVKGTLYFPDAPFAKKEFPTNGSFSMKVPPGLYQVEVKADNMLLQGRRVSIGPGETVVYDTILRPIPKVRQAETTGSKISLRGVINFGFNSDVIQKDSFGILDEVADIILSHPEYRLIRIEGHTDDVGGAPYNLSLSDRRARAVMNYLLNKGVGPERLQPIGWGKAKPLAEGSDEAARALNRRVEFNVRAQN